MHPGYPDTGASPPPPPAISLSIRLPCAVILLHPLTIFATDYPLHPIGIVQIPAQGLADAGLERLGWLPTEFLAALRCVDRIAPIMSRPVGDIGDQGFVGLSVRGRPQFVEYPADRAHDIDIRALIVAAYVVGLTRTTLAQFQPDRRAIIAA